MSGGDPDGQVVIYRFVRYGSHPSDTAMEAFIRQKWQQENKHFKEGVMQMASSVLVKFRKLLELMAGYPNRRDNVLKQMQVSELPLSSKPISLLVSEVQSKVETLTSDLEEVHMPEVIRIAAKLALEIERELSLVTPLSQAEMLSLLDAYLQNQHSRLQHEITQSQEAVRRTW